MTEQPYRDPHHRGRLDVNGVEWWVCDPYPTWYRWEGRDLHTRSAYDEEIEWADEPYQSMIGASARLRSRARDAWKTIRGGRS